MISLKDIRQEVREIIRERINANVLTSADWLTHHVMRSHSDIQGSDADLHVILAHKALSAIVKECVGKYEPKPENTDQDLLPGFDYVQCAYPIERGGVRVLVPTDLLTDDEVEARAIEFEGMARGCIAHAKELRAYIRLRASAGAA